MKKVFKVFVAILLCLPLMFALTACGGEEEAYYIVSIEKTGTSVFTDTYTITYSNGSTYKFYVNNGTDGQNGRDGRDITIAEVYDAAVENGFSGTFLDFMEVYLDVEVGDTDAVATNAALLSAVSVYCNFTGTTTGYRLNGGLLEPYTYDYDYTSVGSGIIYQLDKTTGNAYFITNYHVVYSASSKEDIKISDDIVVFLYGMQNNESAVPVTYVGGSMTYDIAVLKAENCNFLKDDTCYRQADVLNSEDVIVGETAIAVGNPEGYGISATKGILSVDSEYISMTAVDGETAVSFRVMRIDTAINGGNSGGGLYNGSGKLIGIVNAKIVDTKIENMAYAIPSNIAIRVSQNIIDNGETVAKKFNFGVKLLGKNSRAVLNSTTHIVGIEEDVTIIELTSELAETIGFQVNDVVDYIKINGVTYNTNRVFSFVDATLLARTGDSIVVGITRGDSNTTLTYVVTAADLSDVV